MIRAISRKLGVPAKTLYTVGLILLGTAAVAYASPLFNPGQTLDPGCLPTNPDCTVTSTMLISNGGTGTSTAPAYGKLLVGNASGGYDLLATSSLNITATGLSGIANGGTGATTFSQGWIFSSGGTGALSASTSPTVAYLTATSTTATSTFPNLSVVNFKKGVVVLMHADGSESYYSATANTDVARGNALLSAVSAATGGDTIYLASTTYDLGNSIIDLQASGGGLNLRGAGRYSSTIKSSANTVVFGTVVSIGSGSNISDLTIQATNSGFGVPLGRYASGTINGAVISNVDLVGFTDGIFINNGVSVTAPIYMYDSEINTNWDTVVWFPSNSNAILNIYNTSITATAVGSVNSQAQVHGPAAESGTLNSYNNTVIAQNAVSENFAYYVLNVGSGATMNIYGGTATSNGSAGNKDLDNNSGTLNVTANTSYNPAKTSGTITYIDNLPLRYDLGSSGASSTILWNQNGVAGWVATSSLGFTLSNLPGTLGVSQGGTGATTFSQGWIFSNGGTGALSASTSPTANYFTATSTKFASVFPYASTTALTVSGFGYFGTASTTNLYVSSLASSSIPFAGAGGLLSASPNFTFDGTTLSVNALNIATTTGQAFPLTDVVMWGDSITAGESGSNVLWNGYVDNDLASIPATIQALTGKSVTNMGFSGQQTTTDYPLMQTLPQTWRYPSIIWLGRNDVSFGGSTTTLVTNIQGMVNLLPSPKNYLVLSIMNATDTPAEWSGGATYASIIATNNALAAAFPGHYFDVRAYMVSLYNPAIPQDVIDHGHDTPPSSLMANGIHPNVTGSYLIAKKITQSYWCGILFSSCPDGTVVTNYALDNIFRTPPAIGASHPNAGYFSTLVLNDIATTTGAANNGTTTATQNKPYVGIISIRGDANTDTSTTSAGTAWGGYVTLKPFISLNDSLNRPSFMLYAPNSDYTSFFAGNAGQAYVNGVRDVGFGGVLNAVSTGAENTAVGYATLNHIVTGNTNTAVGVYAGTALVGSASNNSIFGGYAMYNTTSGQTNTAIGYGSGWYDTTGSNNTFLGAYANQPTNTFGVVSGTNNLLLGYRTGLSSATQVNNAVAVGENALVGCSNCMALGGTGADAVTVGIGSSSPFASLSIQSRTSVSPGLSLQIIAANGVITHTITDDGREGIQMQPDGGGHLLNILNTNGQAGVETSSGIAIEGATGGGASIPELLIGTDPSKVTSYIQSLGRSTSLTSVPLSLQPGGGFVGIGTTSPWGMLSLNPNGISGPAFVIGSSTATSFIVTNGGSAAMVGIGTSSPFMPLSVKGNSWLDGSMTVGASNGPLTIGTSTPVGTRASAVRLNVQGNGSTAYSATNVTARIHVGSDQNESYGTWMENINFDGNFQIGALGTRENGVEFPAIYMKESSVGIGSTSPWGQFSINPNALGANVPSFVIGSSTATKFIVTNGGQVGLGTTTPGAGDLLGVAGNVYIGGAGTSTVQNNLDVLGTLHAKLSYTGDLFFANDFSFTEAPLDGTPQGLLLKNQKGSQVLSVDENGNLTVTGDVCSNGAQCWGKSLSSLTQDMSALASSTALSLLSVQATTTESLSELSASVALASTSIAILSTKVDILSSSSTVETLASSTADALASSSPSFISRIASAVLGLIQSAGKWVVGEIDATLAIFGDVKTNSIETQTATIQTATMQTAAVKDGIEMTSPNGQVWCVRVGDTGDFTKTSGSCSAAATSTPAVVASTTAIIQPAVPVDQSTSTVILIDSQASSTLPTSTSTIVVFASSTASIATSSPGPAIAPIATSTVSSSETTPPTSTVSSTEPVAPADASIPPSLPAPSPADASSTQPSGN